MNQAAENSKTIIGPGRDLRDARVEARLSPEDVARALQLSVRHIISIENDDYEQLPAATYVRGYLRGYAQLVGLNPERVLDRFNQLPIANRRQGLTPPAPAAQVTSSDSLIKLGTLAVGGVMIGLAIVWWQGQEPSRAPVVPPVALSPEAPPPPIEAAPPAPASAPTPAARAAPEPVPAKPAVAERTPERAAAPSAARESPPVEIDPNAPRARLVLYVTEDSWAEVRDARAQRLIYETVAAGRVVTLEGVPPFQVFLGNAEGVRVEINGRDYDVLRHKRGQVARFTVGEGTSP